MVSSTELSFLIGGALGFPPSKVATYLRILREAGALTMKGRGRGAAEMDERDAAALLIACTCSDNARDCVKVVDDAFALPRAAGLTSTASHPSEGAKLAPITLRPEFFLRLPLRTLGLDHTLGDALERLLRLTAADALFPVVTAADFAKGAPRLPTADARFLRVRLISVLRGDSIKMVAASVETGFAGLYIERHHYGDRLGTKRQLRTFEESLDRSNGRDPVTKAVKLRLGIFREIAASL